MDITMILNKYKTVRYNFYKWRYELEILHKISLTFIFACFTGLFAQIRFYIPGTPVPITGQVFMVLLTGIFLGTWGGLSQFMYISFGVLGVPWFAGFSSGLGYLGGPTGGYLIGFVLAAFFLGFIVDKYIRSRHFISMLGLMFFSITVLIYIPGLIQLYLWTGTSIGLFELFSISVLPFLIIDLIKSVIAAGIATSIIPKKAYGNEVDIS
jgi:biotin transport system substrate-specific component